MEKNSSEDNGKNRKEKLRTRSKKILEGENALKK